MTTQRTNAAQAGTQGRGSSLLSLATVPPPVGSTDFLPESWDSHRDSGIAPRFQSALSQDEEKREGFVRGATALGLVGRKKKLQPQQYLLADVLNAGNKFTGVLLPRRSTKTTTLLAWQIGLCLTTEDFLAVYGVMTTQKKARDRFIKDIVPILQRVFPDESTRPFNIRTANGTERLVFNNGSLLQIAGPMGNDYRSDAYDCIVLDESGEADPITGEDVLSAALPTMDTRPGAMLVLAGTAASYREGNMLWDELEKGRAGTPRHGILDFSVNDEGLDPSALKQWETVKPLVLASHPGTIPGGLTPIESVEDNFEALGAEKFSREYLGIFGKVGSSTFIDVPHWNTLALRGDLPSPPKEFRMAYSTHLLGSSASIMAAWRDSDRKPHLLVIDHHKGTEWLAPRLRELGRKYSVPAAYDKGRATDQVVAESLGRDRSNRVKLEPATWPDVSAAAAALLAEIEHGNLVHYAQESLDGAAAAAIKRGTEHSARWNFGIGDEESQDATSLLAGALALRAFDQLKPRVPVSIIT